MPGNQHIRTVISFGPFEANLQTQELRKQGVRLRLPGQSFQILKMLLERPRELVTREELHKALWPSETFVDFEHGVNAAVNRLREVLGDSADNPELIETLPRRGYRFVGVIDRENDQTRTRKLLWIVAAGILCASVAVLLGLNAASLRFWVEGMAGAKKIHSLAVIPLENLSSDPEQEYFADGMTDELIASIAKIRQLRVISRTSVVRYKGTRKPLKEIARELSVDGIVEGTVLRSGNRVRITAQLIEVDTDRHLWAETYERDLRDILALQSDVGQAIAREVRIRLTPQEQSGLARARPVNPEAHEVYLKGRYFLNKRTEDALKKSEMYFRQAIDKDPNDALAYAGLADLYQVLGSWEGGVLPPNVAFPKAKLAAQKALEMDGTLSEAHSSISYAKLYYDWDWTGAESELKRAIELNPNSENAHHWYSHYLLTMGRTEESLAESRRAIDLAPFDPVLNVHLVWHYSFSRQYDLAIQQSRRMQELGLSVYGVYLFGGWALEQQSRFPEAIAWFQKAVAVSGGIVHGRSALGHAYGVSGDKVRGKEVLAQLKELSEKRYVPAYDIAMVYLGIGEKEEAFRWLEKGYEERSAWMAYLNIDPRLDGLRSDPRFRELVHRVGLPQ